MNKTELVDAVAAKNYQTKAVTAAMAQRAHHVVRVFPQSFPWTNWKVENKKASPKTGLTV